MRSLGSREWKALLVLSIVVPVGLLVTFRLTGVLKEPPKTESKTLDLVEWEYARPGQYIDIDEKLQVSFADDELSLLLLLEVFDYVEDKTMMQELGDSLRTAITLNSTVTKPGAFIEGVTITFCENYTASKVWWPNTDLKFSNLSMAEIHYGYGSGVKTRLELRGENHPASAFLSSMPEWDLHSPNNQSHQMEVVCETTYFNGTVYKRLVQPFRLTLDASRHILEVKGVFEANPEANVTVWVDGVEYHTPFRIVVKEGIHSISFQPSVQTDSVIREFQYITVNRNRFEYTPDVALDVHGDKLLEAYYKVT